MPKKKRRRGVNPVKLLSIVAAEGFVILMLLVICVKVFPDNPMIAPFIKPEKKIADVVLDPGHGGYDVGSEYNNVYEKDIALAIAKDVGARLEANGYHVLYTRDSDNVPWADNELADLTKRVEIANESNAKLFVSIHTNATEVPNDTYGYEVWGKIKNQEVFQLSNNILNEMQTLNYSQNRGMKDQDLTPIQVLQDNKLPAVLVETGFLASDNDREFLVNESKRKMLADKIADGIIRTLRDKETEK